MAEPWTVLRILEWTADYFDRKGIEGGRREAELLLADVLGLDRVGLYLQFDRPLEEAERQAYRERVERRAKREPLQYILGETEFWSLPIRVRPGVLIPRADTEILVEEALRVLGEHPQGKVLDVGTGSGAVAIAIASEHAQLKVLGVDISEDALAQSRENAALNAVSGQMEWRQQSLFDLQGEDVTLLVSNPPYIPTADIIGLMPEVRDHEPRIALDGGVDGLDAYRALARQAPRLLSPGGWLLVEVGIGQAEEVSGLFEEAGLGEVFVRRDYAGIERVVGARNKQQEHPTVLKRI